MKRECVYCGKVGSRTQVVGGFAHKRCIPACRKVKYPEHDKLTAVHDESVAVGAFLEWLAMQNISLCTPHEHDAGCKNDPGEYPTYVCGLRNHEFILARKNTDALMADFFGIGQKELEVEKRQMMKQLRAGREVNNG